MLGALAMAASLSFARAENLPVTVQKVEYASYAAPLELSGDIHARLNVDLSFRVSGQIVERSADVGTHVQPGDVLARLDDAEQQTSLRAAQASRDAAQAMLVEAEAAYQRQRQLLDQGFTTRSRFDQAEQQWLTARNTLTSAESALENARDELSYTELRAPSAGIVTSRDIEVGQVVQAAQPVFALAEDGGRDVVLDVQETLVSHGPPGTRVTLALLSDRSVKAEGRVREVSPVVDARTGTVRVKVTASVHLPGERAVVLPWSALTSDAGKPAVWQVEPDTGVVSLTPVEVLAYERERLILRSGLEEGTTVVVKGGQMLHRGQVVDILDAETQSGGQ
jgi:RND family efflux transporter MFP subunit